jgi:membrane-associated phospholipid phosphatase
MDRSLRQWIVEHRVDVLDPVFQVLTYAGSFGLVWLALAFAVSGFSLRRPWLPARVAVTILIAEMSSGLLKLWFDRDRPAVTTPDPAPIIDLPPTASFPSGHATVAFACATALTLAVPRLAVAFYALAALIAFSRVYVGVHYPGDILAGALLGLAVALVVARAGRVLRRVAVRGATAPRTPRADRPRSRRTRRGG